MAQNARPQWEAARGGFKNTDTFAAPTNSVSALNLPAQTKLKYRQSGQDAPGELSREQLKEELERRENEWLMKTKRKMSKNGGSVQNHEEDEEERQREEKRRKLLEMAGDSGSDKEADSDNSNSNSDSDDSEDSSDSDSEESEDDTAELLRELEKIKRERAEERERLEREKSQEEARNREVEIATGNPLLNPSFTVKRRWDDDVVFKNQAKGVDENPKKRFVNDLLRSDFHRKFMNKYIK